MDEYHATGFCEECGGRRVYAVNEMHTHLKIYDAFRADDDGGPYRFSPYIRQILDRWGSGQMMPFELGGFLTAVLSNHLSNGIALADAENSRDLHSIVQYVYNQLPGGCWGSPKKMEKWPTVHQAANAALLME